MSAPFISFAVVVVLLLPFCCFVVAVAVAVTQT
jgi:hypothetical protein